MKFKEFLSSKGGYYGMIIILYAIIWGIMVALTATNSTTIGLIYFALFAFFGWKSLSKITPDIFLIMPLVGWVIYFVIKLILSVIIGMFVAPYQIAKKISASVQNSLHE